MNLHSAGKLALAAASLLSVTVFSSASAATDPFRWFDDAKLGLFIHWGLYAIPARGEWVMKKEGFTPEAYAKFAGEFRPPASFSPEEWVILGKRMGAKYAVLTTRHHDGFALWNTKTTDFNAYKTCGRDFVREFAEACRKHGLRVGFYYSILDWQYRPKPDGTYDPAVWDAYLKCLHGALRELMTDYGRVDMLWYDGCASPAGSDPEAIDRSLGIGALNRMAQKLQPGIIINNRGLVGGDFLTPEQSLAAPARGVRWESCMTVNRSWGYTAKDTDWKSPETLIRSLLHCVRLGGNLLLNIGPKADGSVPPECVSRIEALGDYVARCPDAIYGARRDDWTEFVHEAGPVARANGAYWLHALGGDSRLDGVETMTRVADGIYRVAFRADAKPANWLGGRHDLAVKAGDAPVLGDATGAYDPEEGAVTPSATADVTVPAAGEWTVKIGYVNAEGFKDTASFPLKTDAAKTVTLPVAGAKGYYAHQIIPAWRPVDPKRWQVAGVFPGNFVGTGKYESIVEANDRDMLALARTATFVPVGAENDKAKCANVRVSFSWSAPTRGFGFGLGKTVVRAPADGTYYAAAAFEYWGDVYVNGERIIRDAKKSKAEPQFVHFKPVAFPIRLKAGDNELLIVNHGGSGAHFFAFYLNFPNLPEAKPDAGGTTFDFGRISDARFRLPAVGEKGNLVDGAAWEHRIELHVRPNDLPGYGEIKKNLAPAISWRAAEGVQTVALDRAQVLATVGEKYATCASASFVRDIRLASTNGGPHTVSMRYRMRHTLGDKGFVIVFYKKRNPATGAWEMMKDVKQSYGFYDLSVLENESADWNIFSATYDMPAGAEVAEVSVRIDGAGELSFRDPGVVRAQAAAKPWNLVLAPHGWLDGTFALSSGQCGVMMTRWKKVGRTAPKADACTFELTLPKGVRFLAANFCDRARTAVEPAAGGGTRCRIAFPRGYDFSAPWGDTTQPAILVATDLPPGMAGEGSFVLTADGEEVSNVVPIRFTVVPRIAATAPKRLWSVMFPYEGTAEFDSAEATEGYAEFLAAAGVRWVMPRGYRADTYAAWRKAGIRRITPSSKIANGYHFGDDKGRPADERYVIDPKSVSDSWDNYLKTATCPLAVIEKRPFYRDTTLPYLKAHLAGTDGLWANWEPFMFKGRGCNCDRCNAAFEAWHRETGGDRAAFRSMLHGKMVRALDEDVRAATGSEASCGFIPAVTWRSVSSAWRELKPSPESRPQDYLSSLRWLNAWGPYVYWAAETPYVYQKRGTLAHFVAARDVRAQLDADFPDAAARPKLMSMPQGLQCGNWVAQPEWIAMSMDAFAFNRWEANAPGFFPMGYDARYWRAFADATTRAARYEDFILDGRRVDDRTELKPVAEYAQPCGYVSTYLPKIKDVPMLQQATYEKDGVRIVAVFNFWEKGEAFFTMKCRSLKDGAYDLVDEDGVAYVKDGGAPYTARDLAEGVRLAVGACRTKVFELRPAGGAERLTAVMPAAALAARFAARRSALAAAAEEDLRYEAANAVTQDSKGEL